MRSPPPPPRGPTPPPRGRGPAPKPPVKVTVPRRASARSGPAWLARARRLITEPTKEWAAIAAEFTTAGPIYRSFLVPMAAIGPVAATLGTIISGGERSSLAGTYQISLTDAVTRGVLEYGLNLVGVYLLAVVIDLLAGVLGGQGNRVQALKVAAYGSAPYWLGGVLGVLPKLAPIGLLLGLYSVRVYAVGLPTVMGTPRQKTAAYTALASAGAAIIVLVISAVLQLVVS